METKIFRIDGNVITVDFTGSLAMAEFEKWLEERYVA